MARPRKPRRNPEKAPRSREQLYEMQSLARDFYLDFGGAQLDEQIDALAYSTRAFNSQMEYAEKDGNAKQPWGPDVSVYEARMTAGRSAVLQRLRGQLMQQCLAWAEEAQEAEAARAAAETVPEVPDCPRSSEAETVVQAAKARPQEKEEPTAHGPAKDGDSPQRRGQSPLPPTGSLLRGDETEEELFALLDKLETQSGLPKGGRGVSIPGVRAR